MIKFFHDTRHRFSNLRKNPVMFDDMLLPMDNTRPHATVITQQYLAGMGLWLVYQSPYSLDLNLCDRFLFTRLKEVVRPVQYDSNDEVVKVAQYCLLSLGED